LSPFPPTNNSDHRIGEVNLALSPFPPTNNSDHRIGEVKEASTVKTTPNFEQFTATKSK